VVGFDNNFYELLIIYKIVLARYPPSIDVANPSNLPTVLLWRSSPDQFGNTKRLMNTHIAQPMAIVLRRSLVNDTTSCWR